MNTIRCVTCRETGVVAAGVYPQSWMEPGRQKLCNQPFSGGWRGHSWPRYTHKHAVNINHNEIQTATLFWVGHIAGCSVFSLYLFIQLFILLCLHRCGRSLAVIHTYTFLTISTKRHCSSTRCCGGHTIFIYCTSHGTIDPY